MREPNTYYRVELTKAVLLMGNYELGVNLLDILEVNIVSENLIIVALMELV